MVKKEFEVMSHSMERFVPGEDFEDYVDVFEQYCVAKGVAEDKKVAELLSAIGVDTFRILKSLTFPTKPKDKPLEDIVTVLTDHFRPSANPVAERYKFNKRIQQQGESASSYVLELKMLSQTCNYGSHLQDALRDRFISGLRDDKLQKQLINTEGLTFEQAVKTATSWELADEHVKTVKAGNAELSQYNAVAEYRMRKKANSTRQRGWGASMPQALNQQVSNKAGFSSQNGAIPKRCVRCGINNPRHSQSNCWTLAKPCFACGQFGHSIRMCKQAARANFCGEAAEEDSDSSTSGEQDTASNMVNHWTPINHLANGGYPIVWAPGPYAAAQQTPGPFQFNYGGSGQAAPVVECVPSEEEEDEQQLRIGHVGPTFSAPTYAEMYLEHKFIKMEIDTGACTSVISYVMYLRYFSFKPLIIVNNNLQVITGKKINVAGKCQLKVW
jgi:hypothetical protein